MAEPAPLEAAVTRAKAGDRAALDAVVRAVHKDVYNLALRFLWHPQDAEDAAQEIMIRVVTGLATFRGESAFRTWVYRVACNALLTLKQQRMEERRLSFEAFGKDLADGLAERTPSDEPGPERRLLLEEIKVGCTLAMLLCLGRDERIAYILGEILELDHAEAAAALEISPAAFRKRLSRARGGINSFMQAHCGLANPANACRCHRRADAAVRLGRVDPANLLFASSAEQAKRFPRVLAEIRRLEDTRRAAALYRSHPRAEPSAAFAQWLKGLLESPQT
jgi:RNA polymerase sigma factor (sigma-70 family)